MIVGLFDLQRTAWFRFSSNSNDENVHVCQCFGTSSGDASDISKTSTTVFFTSSGFFLPHFSSFSLANAIFIVISIPNCRPSITSSACGLEQSAMKEVYAHCRLILYFSMSSIFSTGSRSNFPSSLIASSRISWNFHLVERSSIEIHSSAVFALYSPITLSQANTPLNPKTRTDGHSLTHGG